MLEKMKEIIAEQLGVEEDEITPDTSFKEDLGADSLDLFELTMALEEEYDTEIPAEKLASIAHIDIEQYARDMFDAGSNLREKSAKEIFYQDFKKFNDSNINFGVGQISSMNKEELSACKGKLLPYMEEVRTSYGLDMVFFMMTDIINESTELLMVGEMCKEVIENAFETTVEDSSAELPGVVSRKKQLIPAILGQLS